MGRFDPVYQPTLTIANGAAVSDAVDISVLGLRGGRLTISGWTAADIGFQVSNFINSDNPNTPPDAADSSWETLYRPTADGTDVEPVRLRGILTSGKIRYSLPPDIWIAEGAKWFRLVSRSNANFANNVNQGATRTIQFGILA